MICALTVRRLEPGTFEQFREAFLPDRGDPPEGWVRFDMLRNVDDPDEVITFGFFDGTVDDLRRSAREDDYEGQLQQIQPFVASVGTDGLFEIVEDFARAGG